MLLTSLGQIPSIVSNPPPKKPRISHVLISSAVAPARAIEGFQAVQFDGAVNTTNPWKGPPSENLDVAWSELFEGK